MEMVRLRQKNSISQKYPQEFHWKLSITFFNEKKCSEATQTLCADCSKAEPKIITLLQTPFPGALDGQILISWRWSLP